MLQVILANTYVQVHIELGLCEALCSEAMRLTVPAKDGKWFPDISELEAVFPDRTLDRSATRIYQQVFPPVYSFFFLSRIIFSSIFNECELAFQFVQLPQWEEPISDARKRYETAIVALADQFPHENLLLVTHGLLCFFSD